MCGSGGLDLPTSLSLSFSDHERCLKQKWVAVFCLEPRLSGRSSAQDVGTGGQRGRTEVTLSVFSDAGC
eukprot:3073732-Rhodomonas_salina.3